MLWVRMAHRLPGSRRRGVHDVGICVDETFSSVPVAYPLGR